MPSSEKHARTRVPVLCFPSMPGIDNSVLESLTRFARFVVVHTLFFIYFEYIRCVDVSYVQLLCSVQRALLFIVRKRNLSFLLLCRTYSSTTCSAIRVRS